LETPFRLCWLSTSAGRCQILYNIVMQDHAYVAMRQMQERHWWWQGMRRLYHVALARFLSDHHDARRIIDVGCGFGANLPVLDQFGDVVGVDVSLDALRAIQNRPRLGLVQAQADALPFRAGTFDVIALLAVVEHVEHDDRVLTESYRVARPGAIQILLTSAFMLLWSHHDTANNHRRRYRAHQLDRIQRLAGWQIVATSYVNSFIFPAAAVVRIVQRSQRAGQVAAYDMGPDLGLLNRVLRVLLGVEAWLVAHGIRLPFGVDLFSVARRHDIHT
jgi:SAM-dependent methyltransferase